MKQFLFQLVNVVSLYFNQTLIAPLPSKKNIHYIFFFALFFALPFVSTQSANHNNWRTQDFYHESVNLTTDDFTAIKYTNENGETMNRVRMTLEGNNYARNRIIDVYLAYPSNKTFSHFEIIGIDKKNTTTFNGVKIQYRKETKLPHQEITRTRQQYINDIDGMLSNNVQLVDDIVRLAPPSYNALSYKKFRVNLTNHENYQIQYFTTARIGEEDKVYLFVNSSFAGGSGTAIDPYIVVGCDQLQEVKDFLTSSFIMNSTIDCSPSIDWNSGDGFIPIGDFNAGAGFEGVFDGRGHTINNVWINNASLEIGGLFGYVTNGAYLTNFSLVNNGSYKIEGLFGMGSVIGGLEVSNASHIYTISNVTSNDVISGGAIGIMVGSDVLNVSSSSYVTAVAGAGGLVGQMLGSNISNSWADGTVNVSDTTAGGLIAFADNDDGNQDFPFINNSYSKGNVISYGTNNNLLGGLIGTTTNVTILNSYATGNITTNGDEGAYVGGLGGSTTLTTITNAFSNGSITLSNPYEFVGGLIGFSQNDTIVNSYSNSNITASAIGTNFTGGFIGTSSESVISNSYSTGNINGDNTVGGFIGVISGGNITNANSTGNVVGRITTGGFAGQIVGYINNSFATGKVFGVTDTGGFAGRNSHLVENIYATGNVTGINQTGGVLGRNINNNLSGIYSNSYVNGVYEIGGLIGRNQNASITNSNSTAIVNGSDTVGGLIGVQIDTIIRNSFSTSNLTGTIQVGGIVGYTNTSLINNSYATGNVNGTTHIGGLIGLSELTTINYSWASGTVNGSSNVGGLVGQSKTSLIYNSNATGNVTGNSNTGGLIGLSISISSISSSSATGSIFGGNETGGLVGQGTNNTIINSYYRGRINGENNVGGLVGVHNQSFIKQSYANSNITATNRVGGLIGWHNGFISPASGILINNTYSCGTVNGFDIVGGLIGQVDGESSNHFGNSFSANRVNGSTLRGGFVGDFNPVIFTINDNFWDGNISYGLSDSGNGANFPNSLISENSTAELGQQSTFTNWDFGDTWNINAGNSYPYLGWQSGADCNYFVDGVAPQIQFVSPTATNNTATNNNFIEVNVTASDTYFHTITIRLYNSSHALINSSTLNNTQFFLNFTGLSNGLYLYNATANDTYANQNSTETRWLNITAPVQCQEAMLGNGSLLNPCQITNWTQLQSMNQTLNFHYKLVNNLNSTTAGYSNYQFPSTFIPVGDVNNKFTGGFNGSFFNISDLFINVTGNLTGLFGYADRSYLENVGLLNVSIIANASQIDIGGGYTSVGTVTGIANYTNISNVFSTGIIYNTSNNNVGGLVGLVDNFTMVNNSNSNIEVSGLFFVGGIVGRCNSNTEEFDNTYAKGNVFGSQEVGGFMGLGSCSIRNSYATGNVNGTDFVGGLCGRCGLVELSYATGSVTGNFGVGGLSGNGGNIHRNHANGTVTGNDSVGGVVGIMFNSNIHNTNASNSVTGQTNVGGILGSSLSGTDLASDIFSGTVTGQLYVGGVVGSVDNLSSTRFVSSSGTVNGSSNVGGVIGENYGYVTSSYFTGRVNGTTSNIGGLVGNNEGNVSQSYATGNVNGSTATKVGGLVGQNNLRINDSYSTGNVSGDSKVGGLVGLNDLANITNSYSRGNVNVDAIGGGFVGENSGTIVNSFSTGNITGVFILGGFAGDNTGTITNSFWDNQTSGQSTSDGGTGQTTAQMKLITTFFNVGWDIEFNALDVNNGYPYLAWQIGDTNPIWYIPNDFPPLLASTVSRLYPDFHRNNNSQLYPNFKLRRVTFN